MTYLDYELLRRKYLAAQKSYDELLEEKERLFSRTQPKAVQFDGVQGAGREQSPFDEYLAKKETKQLDERLEEALDLLNCREDLLQRKEQELRCSRDIYDKIYRRRYLDKWRVGRIAMDIGYSESQVYRLLENIRTKICEEMRNDLMYNYNQVKRK